jgi:hypothetical protein
MGECRRMDGNLCIFFGGQHADRATRRRIANWIFQRLISRRIKADTKPRQTVTYAGSHRSVMFSDAAEAARRHSRLYQLEELAVFTLLANEGYSTNVYAGAHLPVMKAFVSGGVDGIAPALRSAKLVELRPRREK